MPKKAPINTDSNFENDANKQYERCMVDSPEMLEYKKKFDLTIDEIAELRCKPYACRLQICISMPQKQKPYHKDVYTGELYRINDPCSTAHYDFTTCVETEVKNLLSKANLQ